MRNYTKKLFSFIILLTIFTSVFSTNIYASEIEESPYLNTYAAYFFYNLTSNFGLNKEGSCGYVAAGMLLSFYDSYWNDGFILEDYDQMGILMPSSYVVSTSPGTKQEVDWTTKPEYTDYNDFIDDYASECLHLRLLQINRDKLGVCDQSSPNQKKYRSTNKPDKGEWEINIYEVKEVIQRYFSLLPNDENSQKIKSNVTIGISANFDDNEPKTNEAIFAEMIEKVISGTPVIYFGYSETTDEGHFMIAYDYNEATDEICFHTGWNTTTSITNKNTDLFIYNTNTAILWFEINEETFSQNCSYNYSYNSSTTISAFCFCQVHSELPSHSDNHILLDSYDSESHYQSCHCGETINVANHNLVCSYLSSTKHIELCTVCDYIDKKANHRYTVISNPTEDGHTLSCACGASTAESHFEHSYISQSKLLHNVYCKCGYFLYSFPHQMVSVGTVNKCRDCGFVGSGGLLPPGQIIAGVEDENDVSTE